MKRRNYIVVMMMSLLLGSCSSEDILSVPNGNGRIRFDVGVSQSEEVMEMPINTTPMTCGNDTLYAHSAALRSIELHNDVTSKTRGTEVDESSFHNNFGLYGYTYDSGQKWADNGSSLQPTIKNENIAKGNPWTSSAYFPGKTKRMAFFAYAPYTTVGINVTDGKGAPKLTYTINSNVSEQKDLLVAKSVDVLGDDASTVALNFKHALTAVKFAVGTITGFDKITKIKISGVKNSGTLSLDGDNWSLSTSTASYTIEKEIDLSTTSGDITGSSTNDLLLLMPQTFSDDNAKLEVTMTNDIGTATFSTPLNGEWKKGYTVKYTLSVERVAGDFHFEVTPSTTSIPMKGGEFELKVRSYYQYSSDDATKIPIPWSGKYKIGNNEYSLSGDGSVNNDIRKIYVPENNSTLTHTQTLAQNQRKGTADKPWNLSNSQGEATVENTANCYVVNSKGTYSIPLVYGCAIKNGENNTKSYGSSTFVNHNGNQITTPYIYKMVTADGAKLVWQDVENMITVNSELGDNGHSLIFTIGDNIAQGNAVVAATVNGTVAWSWHIWVTDRDVSVNAAIPTKAFDTNYTYNFMPVPLGWCDVTDPTVAPCNFYVSLHQGQSGKNLSTTIAQAGSTATSGNFTYYQWGRKDPFVGSSGTDKTCKTWYDGSGTQQSSLKTNNSTRTKVYGITNPEYFIYGARQWDTGTTTYDDWNANLISNTAPSEPFNYTAVEKTVYDPSPVGYKLPPTKAFTGFAKTDATGEQTANGSDFSNGGWNFYTGGQSTGPTDFWIAGGYRNCFSSGSLSYVGSEGYYWSAGPYSNEKGCLMYFNQNAVNPQYNQYRAWGFSVRPVSE